MYCNELISYIWEMERWLQNHCMCCSGFKFLYCYDKGHRWIQRHNTEIFFLNIWNETYTTINEHHKAGYTVTGICCSTGLRKYFVVMTKMPEVQSRYYFNDPATVLNWMEEQYHVGYHPTVIFTAPTLQNTLVVVTKDENISYYSNAYCFKLKYPVPSTGHGWKVLNENIPNTKD